MEYIEDFSLKFNNARRSLFCVFYIIKFNANIISTAGIPKTATITIIHQLNTNVIPILANTNNAIPPKRIFIANLKIIFNGIAIIFKTTITTKKVNIKVNIDPILFPFLLYFLFFKFKNYYTNAF